MQEIWSLPFIHFIYCYLLRCISDLRDAVCRDPRALISGFSKVRYFLFLRMGFFFLDIFFSLYPFSLSSLCATLDSVVRGPTHCFALR
ncbi:hypothetical protein BDR22DRAFT_616423 [Usnea florida]